MLKALIIISTTNDCALSSIADASTRTQYAYELFGATPRDKERAAFTQPPAGEFSSRELCGT